MDDDRDEPAAREQGDLQAKIDAVNGWEVERSWRWRADALRLPPWDADVGKLSGGERRRVALWPPAALRARHAAAG